MTSPAHTEATLAERIEARLDTWDDVPDEDLLAEALTALQQQDAEIRELVSALKLMRSVHVSDPGHVHTLMATQNADELLSKHIKQREKA